MTFRIAQEQAYKGNDRWLWRTWIEAEEGELDKIEVVTWFLHHSFPQPVVTVTDRTSGFGIERTGWGRFQIQAEVKLKNAGSVQLSHWLDLYYPDDEEPGAAAAKEVAVKREVASKAPYRAERPKRVFLSFGSEDTHLAARVRGKLEDGGYRVLDATQVKSNEPLEASINKMIRESDLVMGLVTSDFSSPFLVGELNVAKRTDKPTVALVKSSVGTTFGLDHDLMRVSVDLDAKDLGVNLLHLTDSLARK
jgi:hypothetical protein